MIEKYKLFTVPCLCALWTLMCYGFISEELIPPLLKVKSHVFLLCDIIFLVLGIFSLRDRRDLLIVTSFILLFCLSQYINKAGLIAGLNGSRDFFGFLFALPICRFLLTSKYKTRFRDSFDRQLFIFLIIQAFCVTWQYLKYGPGDHGGGSIGNGFSGIVSTMIYLISFYLLSKKWKVGNFYESLKENKIYIILLFPTFLNETKVSFIFMLAYFLLLMKIDRKFLVKILSVSPLMLIGVLLMGWLYLFITGQQTEDVFSETAMNNYMIGDDQDRLIELAQGVQDGIYDVSWLGEVDLPRFMKIGLVPFALQTSPGGLLLGAGIGQFKGGSVMALTPFAAEWQWLISGSIPYLFFVLIQLGVLGVGWIVFNFILSLYPIKAEGMGRNIRILLYIIFFVIMVYNDSLRFYPLCFLIFYIAAANYKNISLENSFIESRARTDEK